MSDIAERALEAYGQGQLARAARLAQEALTADASDAAAKGAMGLVHARHNRIREAARFLGEALEGGATHAELPAALAFAYGRMNGPEATADHLKDLLAKHPSNTALRIELAQMAYRLGDTETELAVCSEGLEGGDRTPSLLLLYGRGLLTAGRSGEAIEALQDYTGRCPADAEGLYLLGAAHRAAGHLEEARTAYLEAMRQQPFHPRAFYSYMRSGKVAADDPIVKRFEQLQALLRTADDETASYYYYGLGKACEDLGQYDQAWEHYSRGGAKLVKSNRYVRTVTERRFGAIKSVFSSEFLSREAGRGDNTAKPVFIIGMPRSGSTLVEQILSSHGAVTGLGERLDLEKICAPWLEQAPPTGGQRVPWGEMAARYLSQTRAGLQDPSTRTVDKGLHNFILVGAIHLMFPHAVILHTVRDPLDTCFSCFSLRFAYGHEWSNRPADVAHYYRCYRDLMAHWDKVLPGRIVEIRYENLTADLETGVRNLLAACDLEWDPACLSFYESARTVQTASAAQVRKPVGRGSVGRWKRFEPHLVELKDALAEFL